MKSCYCTLLLIGVLASVSGCRNVNDEDIATVAATAVVSCEAAHVTMQTPPSEHTDGENGRARAGEIDGND